MDNEKIINETQRTERPPKKAYDTEYMTEWNREVRYLNSKGIRYVYVRRTKDYGIPQFKYKKTPELFAALQDFYTQIAREKAMNTLDKLMEAAKTVSSSEELLNNMAGHGFVVSPDGGLKLVNVLKNDDETE